ncbi:major facilitator superfamily domain-containing protein [Suillus fuscotomentosus]|uniref:Major facilitator superfamily domain-containing protein n=1 Tax=Suillus fuscotomentosus TaxID=1912939 RepID=A0AAD4E7F3_9AGAM|nr:major facilitator superfamily domain-containing protein [Suillus fuscotomentosus]KAG1900982.1 major facilitator superfamily domain-containing protein [Suillus fuscotomentosus]
MSIQEEKKSDSFTENVVPVPDDGDDFRLLSADARKAAERALVRKLDCRLMPTAVVIYLLNYIDRVAITAARLQGLEQDLGLTTVQYETILAILYVTYCPAQIPSNMILSWISRPSIYIGACVIGWGLTSALTGVTTNYSGIMACRVFIGLPEAAFYPGVMYLLSRWYTRKELAVRSAWFYCGLLISNAFGSLIAAGILGKMQGVLGLSAWRWLFYIEGAITMSFGFLTMWLLPDFPHNTRWLNAAERRLGQVRLAEDAGEADKDSDDLTIYDGLWMALKDPKTIIFMFMGCSQLLGLSYINFFPTLTATLGYDNTITFLMAAPPWIFASACCVLNAWHADKSGERFFHITSWWWVVILGYIVSLSTMATGGRYFSLFLMTTGYCGFALTLTWVSNAIPRPPAKRAVAMGLVNGFGNLGNMMGSYVWNASWGPQYHQSMIIALCSLVLSTILSLLMRWILIKENKNMDMEEKKLMEGPGRARIEEAAKLEGITFEEAMTRRKGFRYLY